MSSPEPVPFLSITLHLAVSALCVSPCVGQDQTVIDRLIQTGSSVSALDVVTSINDEGVVAFTGVDTNSGLSHAFLVSRPDTPSTISFGSATRFFFGAAINNQIPPKVATRDRVTGSPPLFFMRTWLANTSQTQTVIGGSNSPANFDSCAGQCDINDTGVVAFSGLTNGSTQTVLFAGISRPPVAIASHPGNVLLRPQISNDNRIVYRNHLGQIIECLYPPVGCSTIVSAPFSSTGPLPGISPDGAVIGFVGNRGSGNGAFVTFVQNTTRHVIRVAGEGLGDFTSIDDTQRCAVSSRNLTPSSRAITVAFSGSAAGRQGIYVALVTTHLDSGNVLFTVSRPAPLVRVGDTANGTTIGTPTLYDGMNAIGSVAIHASVTSGSVILRATPYPPFTQIDTRWCADKYGNYSGSCPSPRVCSGNHNACCPETIRRWGCTLSVAAAALRSLGVGYGANDLPVDPANFNAWLRGTPDGYRPGDSGCNQSVNLGKILQYSRGQVRYEERSWAVATRIASAAAELHSGNRLILRVAGTSGPEGHKVLALGSEPNDPRGATIRIHDPYFPDRTTLHDGPYGNVFASAVALVPVSGSESLPWLEISARSPVEIVIMDPVGRRSGFDPRSNTRFDEIPDAEYVVDRTEEYGGGLSVQVGPKSFVSWQPVAGTYRIDIYGVGTGPYSIVSNSFDSQGRADSVLVAEGDATPTSLHQRTTTFSRGSGARLPGVTFDGPPSSSCTGPCLISPSTSPTAGTSGFAVWVSNAPPNAASAILIGSAPRPDFAVFLGARIHTDLTLPYLLFALSADSRGRLSLPVPLAPSLRGGRATFQSVSLETGNCETRSDLTSSAAMSIVVQ